MPDLQANKINVNAARNEILHLIYNGKDKIISSGLAKGDAVSGQRSTQKYTNNPGFYGEPNYYESGDDSAKVTINVQDGSEAYNVFQAIYDAQANDASNTVDTFDLMVEYKDKNKKVKFNECIIGNDANQAMNDAAHTVAWSILAGSMVTVAQKPNDPDIPWSDGTSANGGGQTPSNP